MSAIPLVVEEHDDSYTPPDTGTSPVSLPPDADQQELSMNNSSTNIPWQEHFTMGKVVYGREPTISRLLSHLVSLVKDQGSGAGDADIRTEYVDKHPLTGVLKIRLLTIGADECYSVGRDYEQLHLLGQGTYGHVYRCVDRNSKMVFVTKVIPIRIFDYSEVDTLMKLSGTSSQSNCLPLVYGVLVKETMVHILMEFVETTWDKIPVLRVDEMNLRQLLLESLQGLKFLKTYDIIHADIKPQNLGCQGNLTTVKFLDFGSVRKPAETMSMKGMTPHYMPPEVCHQEWTLCTGQVDVWALACSFYVVMHRQHPWEWKVAGIDRHSAKEKFNDYKQVMTWIRESPYEMRSFCVARCQYANYSPGLTHILGAMLHPDPNQRLTPSDGISLLQNLSLTGTMSTLPAPVTQHNFGLMPALSMFRSQSTNRTGSTTSGSSSIYQQDSPLSPIETRPFEPVEPLRVVRVGSVSGAGDGDPLPVYQQYSVPVNTNSGTGFSGHGRNHGTRPKTRAARRRHPLGRIPETEDDSGPWGSQKRKIDSFGGPTPSKVHHIGTIPENSQDQMNQQQQTAHQQVPAVYQGFSGAGEAQYQPQQMGWIGHSETRSSATTSSTYSVQQYQWSTAEQQRPCVDRAAPGEVFVRSAGGTSSASTNTRRETAREGGDIPRMVERMDTTASTESDEETQVVQLGGLDPSSLGRSSGYISDSPPTSDLMISLSYSNSQLSRRFPFNTPILNVIPWVFNSARLLKYGGDRGTVVVYRRMGTSPVPEIWVESPPRGQSNNSTLTENIELEVN